MRSKVLTTVTLALCLALAACGSAPRTPTSAPPAKEVSTPVPARPTNTPVTVQPTVPQGEEFELQQASDLSKLDSYRMQYIMQWETTKDGQKETGSWDIQTEYVRQPPAHRTLWTSTGTEQGDTFEMIQIGTDTYIRSGSEWTAMSSSDQDILGGNQFMTNPFGAIAGEKGKLVRRGESANGVSCDHYAFDESTLGSPFGMASVTKAKGDTWVSTEFQVVVKYAVHYEGSGLAIGGTGGDGTLDIAFDVIPYIAANTTLLAIFPPWSIEGGVNKLIERLKDKETRKRINIDVDETISGWPPWLPGAWPHNLVRATGWQNIVVITVSSPTNKHLEGKNLIEIAEEKNIAPFDAAADLIIEEQGVVMALYFGVSGDINGDEWLRKIISHPRASICTDAIITGKGLPHPATYGTFPKVLGYFSRELKLFTMEEAIRKMTSMSLQRFSIRDRGLIREGCFADITIFDETTVGETGTYLDPAHFPEGIKYVVINGIPVLENGKYKRKLCGHVMRKHQ